MKKEQEKVRKFFKEFLSWKAESIGMWIGAALCEVGFVILMMVPYQKIQIEPKLLILVGLFGCLGPMLYLRPYLLFHEGQDWCSIYEKLKYLPIDLYEIQKMRIEYLLKFAGKIFSVIFVLQLLFAYWSFHEIRLSNIAYAIVAGFVWPVLSNLPTAISKR